MNNRLIEKNKNRQILINEDLHQRLKIKAAKEKKTLKLIVIELLEKALNTELP